MKDWLRQNRGYIGFLLCLALVRTAVADWNPIPSGSMRPTLLEGDVVLVNRLAYDLKVPLTHIALARLGEPQRGDVVTFYSPTTGTHLIKRLVAVPGDVVEMRDERLTINGRPLEYAGATTGMEPMAGQQVPAIRVTEQLGAHAHAIQVLPTLQAMRSFGPLTVPADSYFFLGDNRDNSGDSRYIGVVPRSLLIGRAHHVLVSADILGHWQPRFARIGQKIS
jgi:signal peptidase I